MNTRMDSGEPLYLAGLELVAVVVVDSLTWLEPALGIVS